ncbi:hypothetical protein FBU30_008655 [Linnemannia zychae]|nr:hypothetical protein FBU30_008655 [Linnemannia zychae]
MTRERVQAMRSIIPSGPTGAPVSGISGVVYVACYLDTSGKEVILWEDIQMAFKGALHVRHDLMILPFLKDNNLRTLDPYRIAAVPDAILDVVVDIPKDPHVHLEPKASRPVSTLVGAQPRRNPALSPIDTAELTNNALTFRTLQYVPENYIHRPLQYGHAADSKEPVDQTVSFAPQHQDFDNSQQSNNFTLPSPVTTPVSPISIYDNNLKSEVELFPPKYQPTTEWIPRLSTNRHVSTQSNLSQSHNIYKSASQIPPQSPTNDPEWTILPIKDMRLRSSKLGFSIHQDYVTAIHWLQKAAKQGHSDAQNTLGIMFEGGYGTPRNPAKAMEWYLQAAKQGNVKAQNNIGYLYEKGEGVPQDYAKAVRWILKAAHQGYDQAQFNIGVLYKYGRGVPQDFSKAMNCHGMVSKAAMQGDADAQNSIGILCEQGQGVQQDYSKAMEWLLMAARQGYAQAEYNIGVLYKQRQGVDQSHLLAMEWSSKAAAQGYAQAQFNIGYMYDRG